MINKPAKIDKEFFERRNEKVKEFTDKTKEVWEGRKVKFIDDLRASYDNSKGKSPVYKYHKVS